MKIEVDLYQLIRYRYAVEGASMRRIARELVNIKAYGQEILPWRGHAMGA